MKNYILDSRIADFPSEAEKAFLLFWKSVTTIESSSSITPIIFQDQKSKSYYVECHILASVADPLLDPDAVLDPDEQVEYRANRSIQEEHRAFAQMLEDAQKGRQFSDLIVEFNQAYEASKPLKVLGGQHRVIAIGDALQDGIDLPHGFKCYFALTREQRNEIAQISNTNIAIPVDLLDRMQETMLRSGLREWCQSVGLLGKGKDFADRKNQEGLITVRSARSFIVNFFEGKSTPYDADALYSPYLCRSSIGGAVDDKYTSLLDAKGEELWQDPDLIRAGKAFAEIHKQQITAIEDNDKLKRFGEFKTKTITPVVTAAFAMVAGSLSSDKKLLTKLFSLSKPANIDPLNAEALSTTKHHTDSDTYRGVGTRSDKKELGRMAEVFVQFVENAKPTLTKLLIELALKSYHAKLAKAEVTKAKNRI